MSLFWYIDEIYWFYPKNDKLIFSYNDAFILDDIVEDIIILDCFYCNLIDFDVKSNILNRFILPSPIKIYYY